MGKRLYVGNLSYDSTEDSIRAAFSEGGRTVTDVHIMTDRETGRPRGFGFVEMSSETEAQAAIEALDGTNLDGRSIRVNEARERTGGGGGRGGRGGGGYGGGGGGPGPLVGPRPLQVSKHKHVTFAYTLTAADGTVLDRSPEGEPLEYVHGTNSIIPGLEEALEGTSSGESIQVTVPPESAYGNRDDTLVHDVPRDRFEAGASIEPGMQVTASGPEGDVAMVVVAVGETNVTLDANHPLAGESLHFDVDVVGVREATADELGPG